MPVFYQKLASPASDAAPGSVELATDAEAKAVSSQALAVTPGNLAAVFAEPPALGGTTPAVVTAGTLQVGASDVKLERDAANALALRNGTNAQNFRIYNTYTDASNYERGAVWWLSNALRIGTAQAGTGAVRGITFDVGGTSTWLINTSRHFIAGTDNVYDIGASGATRPRTLFLGSNLIVGGVGVIGAASVAATAIFELSSTTKGFLPPRMTTTERNAISAPAAGLTVYNSTLNKLNFYNGTAWETVTSV